ncbi:MAG: TonB-dependent receptor [Acidobacteriota bacterium]|nr:TonB-dependent receptor [Acidobacteriota bacterium]
MCTVLGQDTGTVTGKVYDKTNGDELIGANVRIEGTTMVAFADINGAFKFASVPVGTYRVVATMDGFSSTTVEEVGVKAGETTNLNIELGMAAFEAEFVVTAELLQDNEVSLLRHRRKANAISDAVSFEVISRGGGSTAADAVTKITGASVVGGKYVVIRGLGDRYTSTHLNGVEMPTSDPDKNSFQADLFPAPVLENIVTIKSFTPDKPGNFSGGIMDIGTKNYPAGFTMNVSVSGSYNSEVTNNDNYLTYDGSDSDWLGKDDGLRALPEGYDDPDFTTPSLFEARRDQEKAEFLDQVTKSFVPVMSGKAESAPVNKGMSFSIGNQTKIGGRTLGYQATLSYKRGYEFREDFEQSRWELTSRPDDAESLNNLSNFNGNHGKDKVAWGGLATLRYHVKDNHQVGLSALYSQNGTSESAFYDGSWPAQFSRDNIFLESRLLKYTERNLTSYQLVGEHFLVKMGDIEIDWALSTADTFQDEPDTRIFTDTRIDKVIDGQAVSDYGITVSTYSQPARYWRKLDETNDGFKFNVNIPIQIRDGLLGKIKFGASTQEKERNFEETRFEYVRENNVQYEGDPDFFFGTNNIGIIGFDERTGRYIFGNVLVKAADSRGGNYVGDQSIDAFYLMTELPINRNLRVITGARYEDSTMNVANDTVSGNLDNQDWLPALHFIYDIGGSMNMRASYGRTLARPHFREMAPYSSFDFIADGIYSGNPDLKRTLIDNFDIRWEWFTGGGELIAASAFYKEFENPIEKAYSVRADFGESSFINVDEATVSGIELEGRRRLTSVDAEHQFSFTANASFIDSEVDVPPEELELLRRLDPDASPTRELQGQSPFLVNAGINYDNFDRGIAASLFYNVFGERLHEVGSNGVPNAFEQPRDILDFTYSQSLMDSLKIKFSAKNLLDAPVEITQSFKGTSFIQTYYKTGTSFSLSLSYKP